MNKIKVGRTVVFELKFPEIPVADLRPSDLALIICEQVRGVSSVHRRPSGNYWVQVRPYYAHMVPWVIEGVLKVVSQYVIDNELECEVEGP